MGEIQVMNQQYAVKQFLKLVVTQAKVPSRKHKVQLVNSRQSIRVKSGQRHRVKVDG